MALISKIKYLLFNKSKFYTFNRICKANKIQLEYKLNQNEVQILSDIFEGREYADYFPFYQKVTIVDIGAHFGYFSIFAHKNTHIQSKIYAIEPDSLNFIRMNENFKKNMIDNIVPINAAVGIKNDFATLYLGRTSNHSLISDYSFLKKEAGVEKVETKTLETILTESNINTIDYLKMDCEGSEYAVLESLSNETFEKITTISLEFHDLKSEKYTGDFLIRLFIRHNFKIVKFQYMKTTMGLNYGKIIATRNFNSFI